MADFITVVKDAELAPQMVGWQPDAAGFFAELLSPVTLFGRVGAADKGLEPLASAAVCATFDGDTGMLEVRIRAGVQLTPDERHVARALLAGVWAPARVRLVQEASEEDARSLDHRESGVLEHRESGVLDGPGVKAVLDAFAPDGDEEELYRNVALALHARGFGELPVGRAWKPPENETELLLCTLAFALRAARAGEEP